MKSMIRVFGKSDNIYSLQQPETMAKPASLKPRSRKSNKDKNKKLNMIEDIPMKSLLHKRRSTISARAKRKERRDEAHYKGDYGRSTTMTIIEKQHDKEHYGLWNIDATVSIRTRKKRKKRPDAAHQGYLNIDAAGSISTTEKRKERLDEDDMNAKRPKLQHTDNEATRLMDIQVGEIKYGKFTLCHKKLIESDAEYFCSQLEPDFSLNKLEFRNCNLDGKFLLAIQKDIPRGKVDHVNFSGNNQLDLPVLKDLMTQWKCKSLDLSNIEFDKKKMNDLQDIPLKTLILDYSSFPVTSNAMEHVAELLQSLENLSFVSSTISTNQLVLIAKNLSGGIKLQSLNLSHVQLGDKGLMAVCKIINKTNGMKYLSLSNSGLSARKLEVFSKKVTPTIEELDLGLNKNIGPTKKIIEKIIEIVKRQHVSILNLTGLALNQRALKQLTASDIPPEQITELNISENSGICMSDVWKLAAKLEIRNLDISECWLREYDLKKLPNCMKNHKLDWIDVTESFRILNEERRKEIQSSLCSVAQEVRIEEARSLTQ